MVPYEKDEVTRVIQDQVDENCYNKIKSLTVGGFREFLLRADEKSIKEIRDGLTSEMIAVVTKLMSNMDLIYGAKKIKDLATCNTAIGKKGSTYISRVHSLFCSI